MFENSVKITGAIKQDQFHKIFQIMRSVGLPTKRTCTLMNLVAWHLLSIDQWGP